MDNRYNNVSVNSEKKSYFKPELADRTADGKLFIPNFNSLYSSKTIEIHKNSPMTKVALGIK